MTGSFFYEVVYALVLTFREGTQNPDQKRREIS
jgi:hypothetical protein